ncbi:MAG TPA: serine/threonine-protein kinase [Candidatus Cloacimonadota bacterium]|nr:serine/threonine-protein kinase [Candidatus Cloacimonadota bacterium]
MILSQGQKVNQYSVISFIGSGGMGEVYLVEEEFTQNRYALKTLFPHHTQNEQFRERFIREAKIMAALNHPGIMQVHSFFQIDQQYYLVMDFLQGQTLKSLLRSNGCLNEPQALDIVGKLLVTLDYASSKGVIHRDIKPDNIYIQPDYSIKVMDFGIARMTSLERVTETGSKLGTLYYMSPEQIRGSSNIDPKTDVYSLGIVFYRRVLCSTKCSSVVFLLTSAQPAIMPSWIRS